MPKLPGVNLSPKEVDGDCWSDKVLFMIVERLPEVLALSTEEKEILAEELLNQVVLEQDKDPALLDLLRRRLNDHAADPASGVRWETLRDRLLKRQHA
jgi:putative addiction module component (TIGR02574 family)